MAEEESGTEDKTEDATQERRDEFREQGQLALSQELTAVSALAGCTYYLFNWWPDTLIQVEKMFVASFESISSKNLNESILLDISQSIWREFLILVIPIFIVIAVISTGITFTQTRLNWSWDRLKPDLSRLNFMSGLGRMFKMSTFIEVLKSICKLISIFIVAYLILRSEWSTVPGLMNWPIISAWSYWGKITEKLFWAIIGFLLVIAAADYMYQFISFERKIKMTKQEVKEDFKRREVDPHVKGRMRRMQRDAMNRNKISKTKKATALITNPTHFSVAIKYELGDPAPVVLAKGEDDLALRMRIVAREEKIPIIENRPLARALYAQVEEGDFIPNKFYGAVAEIIKYVFRLKGRRLPDRRTNPSIPKDSPAAPPYS